MAFINTFPVPSISFPNLTALILPAATRLEFGHTEKASPTKRNAIINFLISISTLQTEICKVMKSDARLNSAYYTLIIVGGWQWIEIGSVDFRQSQTNRKINQENVTGTSVGTQIPLMHTLSGGQSQLPSCCIVAATLIAPVIPTIEVLISVAF